MSEMLCSARSGESPKHAYGLVDRRLHIGFSAHIGMEILGANAQVCRDLPSAVVLDVCQYH
jgi:hypothetical protein